MPGKINKLVPVIDLLFDNGLQGHVLVLDVIILVCWTLVMLPRVSAILATCCLIMEQHA